MLASLLHLQRAGWGEGGVCLIAAFSLTAVLLLIYSKANEIRTGNIQFHILATGCKISSGMGITHIQLQEFAGRKPLSGKGGVGAELFLPLHK